MASVDPYAPCPCGSGQKFKWCCQKVQPFADKAQKLAENGQLDAALQALDEGLRKERDNAWLLSRKAGLLAGQGRLAEARPLLDRILTKQPGHRGARSLLVRIVLETEGATNGAGLLQQALTAAPPEDRPALANLVQMVGLYLQEAGDIPAARAHLKLAEELGGEEEDRDSSAVSALRLIDGNPSVSPWEKDDDEPAPPPPDLPGEARDRFIQALGWIREGLWAPAAAAFDTLAADGVAGADRNLGLCRLWLADDAGAAEALGRWVARAGTAPEAVDAEALRQIIAPPPKDDQVERVHLIWPLRDRAALLAALGAQADVAAAGRGPIDPADDDSPEVDVFDLLDRPALTRTEGIRREDVPRVAGRVLVGQEIVALEAQDDERLDGLTARFRDLAGEAIAPAHPRTKVLGEVARSALPFLTDWRLPEDLAPAEELRLGREQRAHAIREVWPNTPMPFLGGRTPVQAARDGNAEVALRAAVWRLEVSGGLTGTTELADLRQALGLAPEPEPDPATVDVDRIHLARLALIPAERLDDERLIALYQRARRTGQATAAANAAGALAGRPAVFEREAIDPLGVFGDLAVIAATRGDEPEALRLIDRGRQADPPAQRARHAAQWDLLTLRVTANTRPIEQWVADLTVVLERHGADPEANQVIMLGLVNLGLIRVVSPPDQPGRLLLDTRPLEALLARYGPKVTTASGRLGVSATQETIWTPGGPSGSGGGLWTPGSDRPGPPGEKPRLIVPGR